MANQKNSVKADETALAKEDNRIFLKGLASHHNEHIEEIFSYWLIKQFGYKKFKNTNALFNEGDPSITHYDAGNFLGEDSLDGDELLKEEGILAIGIGGGMFDEHPSFNSERKKGVCASTLIAQYLEVSDLPELQKIIKYCQNNDLTGQSSLLNLAHQTKLMQMAKYPFPKILSKIFEQLDLLYEEQRYFHKVAGREAKKAERTITGVGNSMVKIASINTDADRMNEYLRSDFGGNMQVIIQKRNSGHVQIFTCKKAKLSLKKVASEIRKREYEIMTGKPAPNKSDLTKEGNDLVMNWYYQTSGEMLLNGSRSAVEIKPTMISLDEITSIVKMNIVSQKQVTN